MKSAIFFLTAFVGVWGILYGATAFAQWNLNPGEWSFDARMLVAMFGVTGTFVAVPMSGILSEMR